MKPDGVEQFFLGHHAVDQGLAHRLIDGVDAAQEKSQHRNVPKDNDFEVHGEAINDCLNHGQALSDYQHPSAVEAVRNRAAEDAEEQTRHGIEETYQPEQKGRTGELPYEPALSDALHEVAGGRNNVALHEKTKVSMSEGAKGREVVKAAHGQ